MPDHTDRSKRDFGTVLHSACERWVGADDTGRDATGAPVEVFPEGWEWAQDFDGQRRKISGQDADLLRELFADAVERGVLQRPPGRLVEEEYSVQVLDEGGHVVTMTGVMDVVAPARVEDHKNTGSRRWAMSREKLRLDAKMLCYAVEYLRRYPEAPSCLLRLNYFCKDRREKTRTWAVEARVLRSEVDEFWRDQVVPTAREMLHLRLQDLGDDRWRDVEGPREEGACEKYGGCPFARVCGGHATPEDHRRLRQDRRPDMTPAPTTTAAPAKKSPAQVMAEMRAARAAASAPKIDPDPTQVTTIAPPARAVVAPQAVAPAPTPAAPKVDTPTQVPTSTASEAPLPPWTVHKGHRAAASGCLACRGTGVSMKGDPCGPCDYVSGHNGGPTSNMFDLGRDAQGRLTWTPKAGQAVPATPAPEQAAPAAAAPAVSAPATAEPPRRRRRTREEMEAARAAETPKAEAPAPTPQTPPAEKAEQPTVVTNVTDLPEAKEAMRAVVNPGFVLYVNAVPLQSEYVDLNTVLAREGAELAAAKGAASYYEMDAFKRRDALAAHVRTVARELEGKAVVAIGGGQDLKAYLEALRPLATMVVVGTF